MIAATKIAKFACIDFRKISRINLKGIIPLSKCVQVCYGCKANTLKADR
jgi:hypothetical protein